MIKGELDMGKMYKMFLLSAAVCIVLNGCAGEPAAETERNGSVEGLGDVTYSENEVADSPIVFEGYDMDGNAVSSEIFAESKLTMVNVWATYCNPCMREMPGLGELANE